MIVESRIEMLAKLHPSRRTGCKLRKLDSIILVYQRFLEATQQLGGLFDDGQIGGEVRVKDLVKTASPKSGIQFPRNPGPGRKTETLSNRCSRTWSSLNDHVLLRVIDRRPYLVRRILCSQGANGASIDALAAIDADNFPQWHVCECADLGVQPAVRCLENPDFLKIDAGANASSTQNAFVHVANDAIARFVDLMMRFGNVPESVEIDAILLGQRLELAVVAANA